MARSFNITVPTTREDVKVIANKTVTETKNLISRFVPERSPDPSIAQLAVTALELAKQNAELNAQLTALRQLLTK